MRLCLPSSSQHRLPTIVPPASSREQLQLKQLFCSVFKRPFVLLVEAEMKRPGCAGSGYALTQPW